MRTNNIFNYSFGSPVLLFTNLFKHDPNNKNLYRLSCCGIFSQFDHYVSLNFMGNIFKYIDKIKFNFIRIEFKTSCLCCLLYNVYTLISCLINDPSRVKPGFKLKYILFLVGMLTSLFLASNGIHFSKLRNKRGMQGSFWRTTYSKRLCKTSMCCTTLSMLTALNS